MALWFLGGVCVYFKAPAGHWRLGLGWAEASIAKAFVGILFAQRGECTIPSWKMG